MASINFVLVAFNLILTLFSTAKIIDRVYYHLRYNHAEYVVFFCFVIKCDLRQFYDSNEKPIKKVDLIGKFVKDFHRIL